MGSGLWPKSCWGPTLCQAEACDPVEDRPSIAGWSSVGWFVAFTAL